MYPANTIHSPYAGLMLARRLRRRPNINPAYWFNVSCLLGNLYVSGVTHTKSFLSGLNNQMIPSKYELWSTVYDIKTILGQCLTCLLGSARPAVFNLMFKMLIKLRRKPQILISVVTHAWYAAHCYTGDLGIFACLNFR